MRGEEITAAHWEELAEAAKFDAGRLAVLRGISRRQLERDIRRDLDRTPQDWLNERRMRVARELLRSGISVKAVAIELGFKQSSHFCRCFKALHWMTPSEFALKGDDGNSDCRSQATSVAEG